MQGRERCSCLCFDDAIVTGRSLTGTLSQHGDAMMGELGEHVCVSAQHMFVKQLLNDQYIHCESKENPSRFNTDYQRSPLLWFHYRSQLFS